MEHPVFTARKLNQKLIKSIGESRKGMHYNRLCRRN